MFFKQIRLQYTNMNFRLLITIFAVIGLFAACQTTDPLVRNAQSAIQLLDFEEALDFANQALEENPNNVLALYYKGYALGALAEDLQPPSDRLPYYSDMRESMMHAKAVADTMERRPSEIDEIEDFIIYLWAYEHNSGAEIMTSDSVRQATPNPDQTALDHFRNAVTIEPDSSLSYIVMASIQYQTGDMPEATRSYEMAMERMDKPVYEDYEFLISLYFMQNRFEDARDLSREAMQAFPDEALFAQFLADSFLETGETEEALNMLSSLVAENPNNAQYRYAYGTQLYRVAEGDLNNASSTYRRAYQMQEQLGSLSQSERAVVERDIQNLMDEAEQSERQGTELSNQAIEQIQASIEQNPGDDNAYNVLGIIYQNRAAALFDRRNNTRDNELARELDTQARETLNRSMVYYEQAAEINPDETAYWESLFQVYTTLGMDQKAEEAMERAGMNEF